MRPRLPADFAPEWAILAALAVLDCAWARVIGFHLTVTARDGLLLGAALGVMAMLRLAAARQMIGARWGMMAEYFALTAAATLVFGVLSYLSLAASGPLADARLEAIDRGLGFDWMAGYRLLVAHPLFAMPLRLIYDSLVYQGLYFCVLFALMDRRRELREMFWLVLVAGLFTAAGAMLFPAFGPYKLFAVAPAGSFLPEMEHLKSGRDLSFALAHMTGVVSFPSFHTSMALAYVWGFRRTGAIGWLILALNVLMLIAIPWYGGHYLTDMLAGAGVMLASLILVKGVARAASGATASPEYAATSAGAC